VQWEVNLCESLLNTQPKPKEFTDSLQAISVMLKIFYSLNYVDLPEVFEDNMKPWMEIFHKLLTWPPTLLPIEEDGEPNEILLLHSAVCENITLYIEKYEDEFKDYLGIFLPVLWKLITTLSEAPVFDSVRS